MAITTHDTETDVQDRAILVSLVTDNLKAQELNRSFLCTN